MILLRVRAESWGCLRWPVELALHPRVNLIHAPNESGKSTLVSAIRHALLDPASANVDAIRPWGSSLTPRLAVEFRTAAGRFRVEKAYGRHPEARLHRERGGVWEPVADDPDVVHAQTVALVTGVEVGGRRRGRESAEARRARRGVLYVLWREQGRAPLADLELPATAERDLAEAVGTAVVSDRDRRLIEAAERRAGELLTPRRREETGALAAAAAELAAARERLGPRRERVGALRQWEEQAESAAILIPETEGALERARGELAGLSGAVARARELARALERAEAHLGTAARARSDAAARWEDLQAARAELAAAQEASRQQAATEAARRQAVGTLRAEMEQADAETAALEAAAREAGARAELARARLDLARDLAERDAIADRLRRSGPLQAELDAAREARRAISVPDAGGLDELRRLHTSLELETAKLDAGRLRVAFRAERALRVEAETDGAAEAVDLGGGATARWEALERAEVRLEGVGSFRVERALETSLARQRRKVAELRQRLDEALTDSGAASVAALEERAAVARGHEERIGTARATLAGLLPEGREAAERALAQVVARIGALRERHAALAAETPATVAAEAGAESARAEAARLDRELQGHRARVAVLRTGVHEAEAELPELQAAAQASDREAQRLAGRIQTLEGDGLTDAQRQAHLAQLEEDRRAAEAEATRLRAGLGEAADAESAFAAGERAVAELGRTRERLLGEVATARARAAAITEAGSYADLVRAEEDAAAAASAHAALRLRAEARDQLARLLMEARESQRAALFGPVGERAGRLLQRVSAGRYSAVRVGDGLRPTGVVPGDYPEEAPDPEVLSGGAKEQLGTVIRLALAEVLAEADPDGGQALILDEPLPQSDPVRRRRMIEILSEPPPGLQIILLANDARDYAALRRDEEHDLLRLLDASRQAAAAR